jgi:ferric-dicitrate binding protein FerR (iron transport regulator)
MSERDLSERERAALTAWSADEPPLDFADRVLAARQREDASARPSDDSRSDQRRSRALRWGAVTLAGVLAVAFVWIRGGSDAATAGARVVTTRETLRLGHRGVAVAEAGAALAWRIGAGSAAHIEQSAGRIFYRVDPGGPFVVQTPAGRVSVTGTCFLVEVVMKPSKPSVVSAAVGAALSAVVIVTVYEGRVLLASDGGEVAIAAGESATARAGAAPALIDQPAHPAVPDAISLAPPPTDISHADFLARDEGQRAEIARLRDRIAGLETPAAAAADAHRQGDDDDDDWVDDPSPETLAAWAKECRVRLDFPPVFDSEPMQVPPNMAARFDLREEERVVANRLFAGFHERFQEEVRALYVEATGDVDGAATLSLQAMSGEIEDKSAPGEAVRVRQRLARERAGLAPAPTSLVKTSPYERYFRLLAALGDDFEAALAAELGPARARELRAVNGGWGMRMSMAGCPESDEAGADGRTAPTR